MITEKQEKIERLKDCLNDLGINKDLIETIRILNTDPNFMMPDGEVYICFSPRLMMKDFSFVDIKND